MLIVSLLIFAAPGVIAVRIHRRKSNNTKLGAPGLICDGLIYSFLILLIDAGLFYFFTRSGKSSAALPEQLNNLGFVFKYSLVALALALALPLIYERRSNIFKIFASFKTKITQEKNSEDRSIQ
jgi:uncharacterized membrane protein YbhN (UPF0104 family)